jgi:hypothetical protein
MRDIFSLPSLISWLETKPPGEEYNYLSNDNCMLAQYFRAIGFPHARCGGDYVTLHETGKQTDLPDHLRDVAKGSPRTFGWALAYARARAR